MSLFEELSGLIITLLDKKDEIDRLEHELRELKPPQIRQDSISESDYTHVLFYQ